MWYMVMIELDLSKNLWQKQEVICPMSKIAAMMVVIIAFALATGLSAFLSFRSTMSRSRDKQEKEAREAVQEGSMGEKDGKSNDLNEAEQSAEANTKR